MCYFLHFEAGHFCRNQSWRITFVMVHQVGQMRKQWELRRRQKQSGLIAKFDLDGSYYGHVLYLSGWSNNGLFDSRRRLGCLPETTARVSLHFVALLGSLALFIDYFFLKLWHRLICFSPKAKLEQQIEAVNFRRLCFKVRINQTVTDHDHNQVRALSHYLNGIGIYLIK